MKTKMIAAGIATAAALAMGNAQALPIIDGWTAVKLTSAATLVGAGVTPAPLGTALVSPGSSGIPVAYFPVTGGNINTDTFAGFIEHVGSGLSLSKGTTTVKLENFLINTVALSLSGDVTVGATTLPDVALFSIGLTGSPAYPFQLNLTAGAAAALSQFLGLPDLTGAEIGIAGTTPVTAVPEASTYLLMLAGLGAVFWIARRREQPAPQPEPALA